jgi:hypothetical protein
MNGNEQQRFFGLKGLDVLEVSSWAGRGAKWPENIDEGKEGQRPRESGSETERENRGW